MVAERARVMSSAGGAAPGTSPIPVVCVLVRKGMADDSVDLLPDAVPVTGPVWALSSAGGVGCPSGWENVGRSWEKRFVRVAEV